MSATGSIASLEHVNVMVPDQLVATLFYVTALGLTRDPYMMTGLTNMWINVGRNQFHLPTGKAQRLRGHVGLVMPDRAALLRRLALVQPRLADTQFAFEEKAEHVAVTSPWGNRLCCFEPGSRFGRMQLGIPYVEFEVPAGAANGIARFYRQILGAPSTVAGNAATISLGSGQSLIFRESDGAVPAYDGHHIQIYASDFAGIRQRLEPLGLVTENEGPHQYRFTDIVDPDTRTTLFVVEHEVRSLTHPLHARPLVNRNPAQTNRHYVPGADGLSAELAG